MSVWEFHPIGLHDSFSLSGEALMAHTVLLIYFLSDHTILHINQGAIYSSFAELSVSNRPLTVAASVEEEGAALWLYSWSQ